jgi:hypothetical protein
MLYFLGEVIYSYLLLGLMLETDDYSWMQEICVVG